MSFLSKEQDIVIRPAKNSEAAEVAPMLGALWDDCPPEECLQIARMGTGSEAAAPILVAEIEGGFIGFLYLDVRSYAEGCVTKPVPYIEGWWVREGFRGNGIGRRLVEAAEQWAIDQGYKEMGSDAELDNEGSIAAHKALGFLAAKPIVTFSKKLGES